MRPTPVAPSLIPVKSGERIKTDRRDARRLAKLLKANLLTEVHAPSVEEEATRDFWAGRVSGWGSILTRWIGGQPRMIFASCEVLTIKEKK